MVQQFMFTTPFEVELKEDEITLDGFISTTDKDLVNDIVTVNCLKSMLTQIRERNIKLDLEHESFKGETSDQKEIAKTIVPIGRIIDGSVENNGLRIKGILNKYHRRFGETKGSVQNRFLDAFSIAFIPTKVHFEEKGGERIRLLEEVKLLNVALTGNPVNTQAQIASIFMKSIGAVEEKGLTKPEEYLGRPKKKRLPPRGSTGVPTTTEGDEEDEDEDEEDKRGNHPKRKRQRTKTPDDSMVAGAFNKKEIKDLISEYQNDLSLKDQLEVKTNQLLKDISRSLNSDNNHKEVKNMAEEETQTQEQAKPEEATKPESEASEDAGKEKGEEASTGEAESKSLKEIKSELAELKKNIDVLLEQKNQARPKAKLHQAVEDIKSQKIEPLDILR